MKAEQIPDEVAKALQHEFDQHGVFLSLRSAAAIAAATLNAWPGMTSITWDGRLIITLKCPLPSGLWSK